MNRKLRRLIIIFGMLAAISGGLAPVAAMSIGGTVAFYMICSAGVLMGITMVLLMVSMVTAKDMMQKMAVFPVAFALVFTFLILREAGLVGILKQMLGIASPEELAGVNANGVFEIMKYMHVGMLVSAAPLIITAVVKTMKVTKRNNVDFSTYDDAVGQIRQIEDTRTQINHQKVYRIEINIPYYLGENITVKKEFIVPIHMVHLLDVHVDMALKVNPKNKKEVYIVTSQGIL